MRRGAAVRPLGRAERGLLIPWPWTSDDPEAEEPPRGLRSGRLTPFQRWLAIGVFLGVVLALVLLVLLVRALVFALAGSPEPPAAAQAAPPPAPIVESAPPPPPQPQVKFTVRPLEPTYTVVAGDTLSAIAQRYNTTTAALRGINNLAEDAILNVGQRLVIP